MSRTDSNLLRNSLGFLSSNIVLAVQDPLDYLEKVATKLPRQSRAQGPLRLLIQVSKQVTGHVVLKEIELGQLTEAEERLRVNPLAYFQRRDISQQLEVLGLPFPRAADKERGHGAERHIRVLAYLTNALPYSKAGYAVRSHQSLQAMKRQGIQVSAVTRFGYPHIVGTVARQPFQELDGIRYYSMLPSVFPLGRTDRIRVAVDMLVNLARSERANVLLTTTSFENALIVSRAAERLGIPWVYEMRGEPEQTWLSKRRKENQETAQNSDYYVRARQQEEAAALAADAVGVLSEITRARLEQLGVSSDSIYSVPNAVDQSALDFGRVHHSRADVIDQLQLDAETAKFVTDAKVVVGTATSIVSYEGLDTLVRSITHLPDGHNVLIVGDGDERNSLERLAVDEGVDDHIKFMGRRSFDEMPAWYSLMDVFVIPRKDELVCRTVTPIKGLIAQALGIPVVASDLEALREVTGNFETYVAPENPEALAEGIQQARRSGSLAGSKEFDEWLSQRTWESIGREYNRMFTRLVK